MRRTLGLLLVAILVIGALWWLGHEPGGITLRFGAITIETSIIAGLLLAAVLFGLVYLLVRLATHTVRLPGHLHRRRHLRLRGEGERAITHALVALAARDGADAGTQAARARRMLGDTPQTLLLAAYAATLRDDTAEASGLFGKLAERGDSRFLGLRGLTRLASARGDHAAAATLLKQAEAARPGAAWLADERLQRAVRRADWGEAQALTPEPRAQAALAAAAADAAADPAEGVKLAKRAYTLDPKLVPAALAYARRLRETGREKPAASVLREAWARGPHPALGEAAVAAEADPMARLRLAGKLVEAAPEHAESHLLLARLSLAAGLTGEARRHVEAARAAGLDQARVWRLAAEIEAAEGHADARASALARVATATDPGWRCEVCGTAHVTWAPACSQCGAVGRLAWG